MRGDFFLSRNFSLFCACFFSSMLAFSAEGICNDQPSDACCENTCYAYSISQPILEADIGYFFFSNAKMRKIYNGGFDVRISGSYPFFYTSRLGLQAYASVGYQQVHGKSLNAHQGTSIWQVPINLGLKSVIEIVPEIQYYVTLGPRYFFIHQHNHSSFVNRNLSDNGFGGFVNTGFNFFFNRHVIVDVFGEYAYERAHFHSSKTNVYTRNIQVGGFTFGVGLG